MGVMRQSALLEFESSAFAIEQGEDEHTNPGIFGKALAQWLSEQLRATGIPVGEIIAEDFGWCVPVESKPHRLYVACASAEEEPNHWRVFAFAQRGERPLGEENMQRPWGADAITLPNPLLLRTGRQRSADSIFVMARRRTTRSVPTPTPLPAHKY